ncbi:thy-1 membrane glycoprotein [Heteronotia binoei]|uniref:thy-1 membrane glycoprotein n=1 Tax=Heteronotia binoei TaxID=13085 RepID=UPI0029314AD1|nr:thy-1 membrane glycoprotein [Heteronotia binoei]XP_060106770.1 thy-1 membrane glycoprotein [Heteronotia binoei]
MKFTIGIAVLVTVLQFAQCQKIRTLTACIKDQNLRLDCEYDNKTDNPLSYEFRMTKDSRAMRIVASNFGVPETAFRSRANVTLKRNLLHLNVYGFTAADEGIYVCQLKITNDLTGEQTRNVTVVKDKLVKCAGISLLIQNTSWLLLLLLSLPLLQAVDFVSL